MGTEVEVRQFFQRHPQIIPGEQAVGLGCLNKTVNNGAGLCAADRIAEQPVLAPHRKRANGILRPVVGNLATRVFEVVFEIRMLPLSLFYRFLQLPGQRLGRKFIQPVPKSPENRRFFLKACFLPLSRLQLHDFILFGRQLVAVIAALLRQGGRFIRLDGARDGLRELAPHMRPAASPGHLGQPVVSSVPVCMRIPTEISQAFLRILATSPRAVLEQDDWRKPVVPAAVHPHVRPAARSLAKLFQYLYGRLVRVQNVPLQQSLVR